MRPDPTCTTGAGAVADEPSEDLVGDGAPRLADLVDVLVGAWRAEAACRGLDPNVFFPIQGEFIGPARSVCSMCPVSTECLEAGLYEKHGVWGGRSEKERRRIRRTGVIEPLRVADPAEFAGTLLRREPEVEPRPVEVVAPPTASDVVLAELAERGTWEGSTAGLARSLRPKAPTAIRAAVQALRRQGLVHVDVFRDRIGLTDLGREAAAGARHRVGHHARSRA